MLALTGALALGGCEAGDVDRPERPPERGAEPAAGEDGEGTDEAGSPTHRVHFLRSEEVVAVTRPASPVGPGIDGTAEDSLSDAVADALEDLLRGPTPAEREEGLLSAFGDADPTVLDSVRVTEEGRAVVDFGDLPAAYPSGSASAAGAALLEALNRTVFQFSEVREAEYRAQGSCDAFWNWLQRSCSVVPRSDGAAPNGDRPPPGGP